MDALSHKGKRNGAPSNNDSALINDENDCKLLHDYKQKINIPEGMEGDMDFKLVL